MNKVKKKIYTNTFISLVTVFSLLYINIFYLTKNIENSSAEIIKKKKDIEKIIIQNSQIKNTRTETEKLQKNINEASKYVVDYPNISNFVIEMKDTAIKRNLELDMKVEDKEKIKITDGLSYINYNIKAAGKFNEIVRFLAYLENSKYYTNIEKIKISDNDAINSSKDDKIILDLILKVYVWD